MEPIDELINAAQTFYEDARRDENVVWSGFVGRVF